MLYCDTRQHAGKHDAKMRWWEAHGVDTEVRKLDFGDYMTDGSNISIDTKRGVAELAQNVRRDHARFRREIERANEAGCRLVVLVENTDGITRVADVRSWRNPHCRSCKVRRHAGCDPMASTGGCARHRTVKPIQGPQLAKTLGTMEERYGVEFAFCRPQDAARIICERLGVLYEQDAGGR